jgi:hypothetical protein
MHPELNQHQSNINLFAIKSLMFVVCCFVMRRCADTWELGTKAAKGSENMLSSAKTCKHSLGAKKDGFRGFYEPKKALQMIQQFG